MKLCAGGGSTFLYLLSTVFWSICGPVVKRCQSKFILESEMCK